MDEKTIVKIGSRFPGIRSETTTGMVQLPNVFHAKWGVVVNFISEFDPVCTTELYSFQKRLPEFNAIRCSLLGVCSSKMTSILKWTGWMRDKLKTDITIPILSDPFADVSRDLGFITEADNKIATRSVIIIDPIAKVRAIFHYPKELGRNVEEIYRAVKALTVVDANKVDMPANWPINELVGEGVLLHPPSDEDSVKGTILGANSYDWWFSYKKLVRS
ncbi:MAG: redoxin domain-containing protein [Pseudomonadota bacterium]